jgi:metallophosphoesterase (TIGR03767 family)
MARLAAMTGAAYAAPLWVPGYRKAMAQTNAVAVNPELTTLERSIVTSGEGPYFRLAYGPPWPIQVRADLHEPQLGRDDRRVPLATVLHFTDFQFPDAQSPARVEFLDALADEPFVTAVSGAFRPEEALVLQACEAVIRRANAVGGGPVTGRGYDCCVSTGDNFDNKQLNELRWFLQLMSGGGSLAANSGAPDVFEGVQSFDDLLTYDKNYYHPEPNDDPDQYKTLYGFPDYPGLLEAAIEPWDPEGIKAPWYSVWGNHDALVQGNSPTNPIFDTIATGPIKILGPETGTPSALYQLMVEGNPDNLTDITLMPHRVVTADPDRRFVTGREYVAEHRSHTYGGLGPVGHGFTQQNEDEATLYYTFDVAPGIFGITLDTNSTIGAFGSIGEAQLQWLEAQLITAHSTYYEPDGTPVRTGNDDRLVIIFSHHRAESMDFPVPFPDEEGRLEERFSGEVLRDLLHRFPNVILWVNGHSHFNRIVPRPDPSGRTNGFWDITTAAQIDPPQQARIIEVVDNRDGTISIFTTVIDHEAPPEPGSANPHYSLHDLASIARELAYNDYQAGVQNKIGEATDLNTELLLAAREEVVQRPPGRTRFGDELFEAGRRVALPAKQPSPGLEEPLTRRSCHARSPRVEGLGLDLSS